jgi:hypothetical protein
MHLHPEDQEAPFEWESDLRRLLGIHCAADRRVISPDRALAPYQIQKDQRLTCQAFELPRFARSADREELQPESLGYERDLATQELDDQHVSAIG